MVSKTKEAVKQLLKEHNTMSLATLCRNFPCAASLFYASDGFVLYFLSRPESRHVINILLNPNVAATINKDYLEWRNITGLQIVGKASRVPPEETEPARRVYERKYPFLNEMLINEKSLINAAEVDLFKVVPERIRIIDNKVYFGHKAELQL
ncbi:MAG: pyridoxamine 5'-phosphate oxidase family protein [Deltaproteobacteria bacterium]